MAAGGFLVVFADGAGSYVRTGRLPLLGSGTVNLGTGSLVIDATNTAGTLAAVATASKAGTSTTAAAADATRRTTLGVVSTNDGTGAALYGYACTLGTSDGLSPAASAVLARYTYFGDANLDGHVDGQVDGSDYALIDDVFNTRSAPPLSPTALTAAAAQRLASTQVRSRSAVFLRRPLPPTSLPQTATKAGAATLLDDPKRDRAGWESHR